MRARLHRAALAAVSTLALSCGDTSTTPTNQLNLDRPVDVSFACYGGLRITNGMPPTPAQEVTISAQPPRACEIRSQPRATDAQGNPVGPAPVPVGQEDLTTMGGVPIPGAQWIGFILQSEPGTVAIARWSTTTVLDNDGISIQDANALTPGNNGISVGEDPVAIATDRVGCYEVVANAGSCDLSALDINSALEGGTDVRVNRIEVKNALGQPIAARPAAMVAEPVSGSIGAKCTATPQGLVYVAYPGCHLVAAVDTSTGTIVKGIDYSSGTPTLTDGNVSCPAECGGGGTITSGIRPVTLDLEEDERVQERKLVIGAENSPALTIVELGSDSLPLSLRQISLENTTGSLGVTAVSLSPVIGMGGSSGMINDTFAAGGDFQFVYAVATDDTVRVADVRGVNRECDTQVDPRLIDKETNIAALSCFRVGDAATPRRRPGARGPGIELPPDAVPTSVDIFKSVESGIDGSIVGYYGVVSATDGRSFVVNIDDDSYKDFRIPGAPIEIQLPFAIAHQLRDALPLRNLISNINTGSEDNPVYAPICDTFGPDPDSNKGNAGGPRVAANPSRSVPAGVIAAEKVGELPTLRGLLCTGNDATKAVSELAITAPDAVRDLAYPDWRALNDETFALTWEGSLSLDKGNVFIDGPPIRVGQLVSDNQGIRMTDKSGAFCDAGVEQFDILQIRGCDPSVGDAECPIGYTCFVHPNSQVAGLGACMLENEADRLAEACKDFLTSQRRYTINRTEAGVVTLLPRKHVLPTSPLDGCTDDNQCEALADFAAQQATSAQPQDATAEDAHHYKCIVDTERAPVPGTGKRCVESCTQTSDCTTGRICQAGLCMEGVTPPQACVNAPQRFELRAGEAFALLGTRSGYVNTTILDTATGKCTKDPNAHPFDVGRVKLNVPACDPTADPRTGLLPSGAYDANPCSLTVDHTEVAPKYIPGTCTADNPSTEIVTRQAPAIRVHTRGPTFTLVDPYTSGDQRCIRDHLGTLGKIPLTFPGFQLAWRQTGGFTPRILAINPSFPAKVVRGPLQTIWVIDEGDFLSTSITQASTRGKVFRLSIQTGGSIALLQ